MSREIKFRGYSEGTGISGRGGMFEIPSIIELLNNSSYDYGYPSEYVLMQYTGLKDKDGVEIYEGDIVKTEHESIGVMKWHDVSAQFNYDCNELLWSHPIYSMSGEKEVIGNIYQNPELIKLK